MYKLTHAELKDKMLGGWCGISLCRGGFSQHLRLCAG